MANEEENLGEQEQKTPGDALHAGKSALEKGKKAKDTAEKVMKIIKTIITKKGLLIVLAVVIFAVVFIINAGASLYFLNLDTKKRTITSKEKAFGGSVLERRNSWYNWFRNRDWFKFRCKKSFWK